MIGRLAAALLAAAAAHADEVAVEDAPLAADVVVMGERHDNEIHHLNQAYWVESMGATAVVFEMLGPDDALTAMRMRGAPAPRLGEALDWEARGWPDFDTYHPIFAAAGAAAIYGGEVPRARAQSAFAEGAAGAFGAAAPIFGLDRPLPEAELSARVRLQDEAHCGALGADQLPMMVEAQRLRDAALAQAVIAAWEGTGGPVAVITGNGHARTDWGIPAVLALARPDLEVMSIGQLEVVPDTPPPFDAWVHAPDPNAASRPDPCEAFR